MLRVQTQSGSVWHVDVHAHTVVRVTTGLRAGVIRGDGRIIHYEDMNMDRDFAGGPLFMEFTILPHRYLSTSYIKHVDYIKSIIPRRQLLLQA